MMHRNLVNLFFGSILASLGLFDGAWSQAQTTIPIKIKYGNADSVVLKFGRDFRATYCVDSTLDERVLTGVPPLGTFDARFVDPRGDFGSCMGKGLVNDFRSYTSCLDSFKIRVQPPNSSLKFEWSWPDFSLTGGYAFLILKDALFGFVSYDMQSVTHASLPNNLPEWYIIWVPYWDCVEKAIDGDASSPEFRLDQNYPNPFNPRTRIDFNLPHDAAVTLKVYNVFGQEVATLADQQRFPAGENSVAFNAVNLPSGVYYYRLTVNSGTFRQVKQMVLLR